MGADKRMGTAVIPIIRFLSAAARGVISLLTSNLVDNLVDLFQGQRFLFWSLGHDTCHWWRRDTLEVQSVPFHPDDKAV